MPADSQPRDSPPARRSWPSLKPPHQRTHPNPHAKSSPLGRSPLPTPSAVAGQFWATIGVESHLAFTVALIPLVGLLWLGTTVGVGLPWLLAFVGCIAIAFGIYYAIPPREGRHVIARLENVYAAKRFALVSSGIAMFTVFSAISLAVVYPFDSHPAIIIAPTSVTVATTGMTIGLASSYVLVRVLVARALPVTSKTSRIEAAVNRSSAFELAFVLAAVGAPLFIFSAAAFWFGPELIRLEVTLANEDASFLLGGFTAIYLALITRL